MAHRVGQCWRSTAPNGMHNFDAIAGLQALLRMLRTRQDSAVEFDCDPLADQLFAAEQLGNGQLAIELTGLAVQNNLHQWRSSSGQ